ncbi:MAG: lipid-binding SYLF domain-containing protein [Smithellaceae bacterium]|nr:lipid-binding SYLF domain-containing protein [Smithellaceae bacterium]
MKRYLCALTLCALISLFLPASIRAESAEDVKIREATDVLAQITSIPDQEIPEWLLKDAHGIAVIPGVIKAGFFVGGRYGKGVMSVRTEAGNWSMPVFITLAGGSFGWQIGAQSADIILVFKTNRSIDAIRQGKFTLGADASIAAGPVGRQAEASTDVNFKAEIYSYSRARGLFAGLAVQGAVIQLDYDANNAYYGAAVNTDELFKGRAPKEPADARRFIEEIKKTVPRTAL